MALESTSTGRSFPYVGATGWLSRLHELFQRSVPPRVDVEWLTAPDRFSEKFSPANAKQLLAFMEKVGWIDGDGNVQEEGRKLRLVGEPYQQAMKSLVDRWYADLLVQIQDGQITSPEGVENFFVANSSIGRSGRQQMTAVFRWFLREAGFEDQEQQVWGGVRRRAPQPAARTRRNGVAPKRAPRAQRKETPPPAGEGGAAVGVSKKDEESPPDERLATISSVLHINIDGTWDEGRMKAAFRWLDQLLKGSSIDD